MVILSLPLLPSSLLGKNQLLLPVGTRVNGIISTVEKAVASPFSRGQAYMNLNSAPSKSKPPHPVK